MRFTGAEFIYDGVSSINWDLRIITFDTSGKSEEESGIESVLATDVIYRKSKVNYYGRSHNTPLSISMTVGSFTPVSMDDLSLIKGWLLGSSNFVPLQIVQDDMSGIYYNAIITKATDTHVGNFAYAMNLSIQCDAPWAWEEEKTLNKNYISGGVEIDSFSFYCDSVDQDYLYPTIQFTLNGIGTEFSLYNATDNNRLFKFTGLLAGETITANCYDKILTSSTGLYRLSTFNKNWFRLLQKDNIISLIGAISNFQMTYQFAKGG